MLLTIDTSGSRTFVGLGNVANSKLQIRQWIPADQVASGSHSSSLASIVQQMLLKEGCTPDKIKAMVLGNGPGSFTGLRIAFAFAKGFSLVHSTPIVTISSLLAAAWEFKNRSVPIVAIDDARRDEFFAARFDFQNSDDGEAAQIISGEELKQWISSTPSTLLVSTNREMLKHFPLCELSENVSQSLAEIFSHGAKGLKAQMISDIAALKPDYVRAVAAKTIAERQASV